MLSYLLISREDSFPLCYTKADGAKNQEKLKNISKYPEEEKEYNKV
jgi:hypothetical protein